MLPFLLLAAVVIGLLATAIRTQLFSIRLDGRNWEELLSSIQHIDFDHVSWVARDFLEPREGQINLEPPDMWLMLGGREGLRKMRQNADLMLQLAAHAQRWNFDEGVIVTERIRRDALRLRQSVRRIEYTLLLHRVARQSGSLIPFHLHEAASAYYLMRQRLLALYQTSHAGLYPRLVEVL